MAKIYSEKKEVKEVITKELDHVQCDWCGEAIPEEKYYDENRPRLETKIDLTVIHYHCGGGDGYSWKIDDLCLTCGEKLKIYVKKLGITIIEKEIYW